jgi:hypothetical protein
MHPASPRETCYGNPEIASEQAINRLSDAGTGFPSEQGINRDVTNEKHRRSFSGYLHRRRPVRYTELAPTRVKSLFRD